MGQSFSLSASISVNEIDQSTVIPATATTPAAFGGLFLWGPVGSPTLISSEPQLVSTFGKPSNFAPETWFTAASFLAYGNMLYVNRAANTTGRSVTITAANNSSNTLVLSSNTANVQNGDLVFAPGAQSGAYVTNNAVVSNSSSLTIQISSALTSAVNGSIVIVNPNTTFSAVANTTAFTQSLTTFTIANNYVFTNTTFPTDGAVPFIARYPGSLGDSLQVSVCDSPNAYSSNVTTDLGVTFTNNSNTASLGYGSSSNATTALAQLTVGDYLLVGNSSIGKQYLQITSASVSGNNVALTFATPYQLATTYTANTVQRYWQFYNIVPNAPGTSNYQSKFGSNTSVVDQIHIVVVDQDGIITGTPGTVLEPYANLSRNTQATDSSGSPIYYRTVINQNSKYVYNIEDRTTAPSGNNSTVVSSTATTPQTLSFNYGTDGDSEGVVSPAVVTNAYNAYADPNSIDISLVVCGKSDTNGIVPGYIADNITSKRLDCVSFFSPRYSDVVNNVGNELTSIVNFRNNVWNRNTSYAVMDSGYKYMYDKYNNVYRWIPLNGDVAGTCVRTDNVAAPWYAPAGYNRGQILNIIKLAYNPNSSDRIILAGATVNPVVTDKGLGTVLLNQMTCLSNTGSSFSDLNVRRLFIVLEKAIATAAKFMLFEFNDTNTQQQFISMVTPYLRKVKGGRGISAFDVICDATNNTPEVINSDGFVGDIYIVPNKAIRAIQLNFINTPNGVTFTES